MSHVYCAYARSQSMSSPSSRQTRRTVFSKGASGVVAFIPTPGRRVAGAVARPPGGGILGRVTATRRDLRAGTPAARAFGHAACCRGRAERRSADRVAAALHASERRALEDARVAHRAALRRRPAIAVAAVGLGLLGALAVA